MAKLANKILIEFQASFTFPASVVIAENMVGRFMGNEDVQQIADDYGHSIQDVFRAIRFFILKAKGSKKAVEIYSQMQAQRFPKNNT